MFSRVVTPERPTIRMPSASAARERASATARIGGESITTYSNLCRNFPTRSTIALEEISVPGSPCGAPPASTVKLVTDPWGTNASSRSTLPASTSPRPRAPLTPNEDATPRLRRSASTMQVDPCCARASAKLTESMVLPSPGSAEAIISTRAAPPLFRQERRTAV